MMKTNICVLALILMALFVSSTWAFNDKVMFSGVTQEDGIDVLEGHMKKTGRYDSGIVSALRTIARNQVGSGQHYDNFFARVTVPEDVKLVLSDGTVIGDEVCVGDTISLKTGAAKGEFWQDGGDYDTPPVYWVDDVEETTYEILEEIRSHWSRGTYKPTDLGDGTCMEGDVLVDDLSGLTVYKGTGVLTEDPVASCLAASSGVVYCSLNENPSTINGQYYDGATYTVKDGGVLEVDSTYSLKCAYYAYEYRTTSEMMDTFFSKIGITLSDTFGEASGDCCLTVQAPAIPIYVGEYMHLDMSSDDLMDISKIMSATDFYTKYQNALENAKSGDHDYFVVDRFGVDKTLRVVYPADDDVELSVPDGDIIFGEVNNLRVLVRNNGDVNVSLEDVGFNAPHELIVCDSVVVGPGAEAECLLSVTPEEGEGLSVDVSYEYKSCGRFKTGEASKEIIKSTTLSPSNAAQVYGIEVYGGCENAYYACDATAKDGLYTAGYRCLEKEGYYTPANGRFNLLFDLSGIQDCSAVSSARLVLNALKMNKAQDVEVYRINNDWPQVSCSPGGDICTQPYCAECKPLYEASPSLLSSVKVSSLGDYYVDVTDAVKKACGGDKKLSLQIRGDEGVWDISGVSSCGADYEWNEYGVSFQSTGTKMPRLQVFSP